MHNNIFRTHKTKTDAKLQTYIGDILRLKKYCSSAIGTCLNILSAYITVDDLLSVNKLI